MHYKMSFIVLVFFPIFSNHFSRALCILSLFQPFLGIGEVSNKITGKIKMGSDTLAHLDGHWDQDIFIKDKATGVGVSCSLENSHIQSFTQLFSDVQASIIMAE